MEWFIVGVSAVLIYVSTSHAYAQGKRHGYSEAWQQAKRVTFDVARESFNESGATPAELSGRWQVLERVLTRLGVSA